MYAVKRPPLSAVSSFIVNSALAYRKKKMSVHFTVTVVTLIPNKLKLEYCSL